LISGFQLAGHKSNTSCGLFLKGSHTAGKTMINVNSVIKRIRIQLTFSRL